MISIDLSGGGWQPADYSDHTKMLAGVALSKGLVEHEPGSLTARCLSLSGPNVWHPAASVEGGKVIGVTCTCPNGQKGGIRARCWHAAALERLIDG